MFCPTVRADIHYVWTNSPSPAAPYTNWHTAAHVIQDAVDAAASGDIVALRKGRYVLNDTVTVPDGITIQGVESVTHTIIDGNGTYQCVYLGGEAACLKGVTVTRGLASYGGGVGGAGRVDGCYIVNNTATGYGGGAAVALAVNCFIRGNMATGGGGTTGGEQYNCTIVHNVATQFGGGTIEGNQYNCIIYFNFASVAGNNYWATTGSPHLVFCCTAPADTGNGNIERDPRLASEASPHLLASSPCIGTGNNSFTNGTQDIEGEDRLAGPVVDIGCDEFWREAVTGALSVAIAPDALTVTLGRTAEPRPLISGKAIGYTWDFGDGTELNDDPTPAHTYASTGTYSMVLWASNLTHRSSATSVVTVTEVRYRYVSRDGNHVWPYASWSDAATNIQAAIDATHVPGEVVIVSNGVYNSGGRILHEQQLNRVVLTNGVTVRSLSGRGQTHLVGGGVALPHGCRCAYIGSDCVLEGFTLSGGTTMTNGSDMVFDTSGDPISVGAGALLEPGAVLRDCLVVSNSAAASGGGVLGGTVIDSELCWNTAPGEGVAAAASEIVRCRITDHAGYVILVLCDIQDSVIRDNNAWAVCRLGDYRNTAVIRNSGMALNFPSLVENCTICWNTNSESHPAVIVAGSIVNSIIYYNTSASPTPNLSFVGSMTSSCTVPDQGFADTITNPPLFVVNGEHAYHLSSESPCINRGTTSAWMFDADDVDGEPRIFNGTPDIGASEFTIRARLRAAIAGTRSNGLLRTVLLDAGVLPMTSPYAADIETLETIPDGTVDWVLIDVRKREGWEPVLSQSAFLLADGRIASTAGRPDMLLEMPVGDYHVGIHHRNSVSAASPPIAFTNRVITLDFTTDSSQYLGGTNGVVQLPNGEWSLISGDVDGDGRVTWVDRVMVSNALGQTGYLQADVNLDGVVSEDDLP